MGAATSQNITDPRLNGRLIDQIVALGGAEEALARVVADTADRDFRQLMVVDAKGRTAVFHGAQTLGTYAAAQDDGVVAAGNMHAGEGVPIAIVAAFGDGVGELEERLLFALHAALAAGCEEGPMHSVGLAVVADVEWRVTDLRRLARRPRRRARPAARRLAAAARRLRAAWPRPRVGPGE